MILKAINTKTFKVAYGVILPIAVVLVLLGVASFNNRTRLLGSVPSDLMIRIMLTTWFCGLYIRLSRFSSFSFYPNKKWTKSDVDGIEKYYYIGMSGFFSIGCGIITWWAVQWFLPGCSSFAYVIASLNSLIVFLPMAVQYWVLKL